MTGYDSETCWRDYRLGTIQAPLISALGFAFAAATERGDDMVVDMLQPGCRAIRDLGRGTLSTGYRLNRPARYSARHALRASLPLVVRGMVPAATSRTSATRI